MGRPASQPDQLSATEANSAARARRLVAGQVPAS